MAQGSFPRADSQRSLAASSGPPPVSKASLKASSNSLRRRDLPAGFPDCPGFHRAAGLPETPGLNFPFDFILLISREMQGIMQAGCNLWGAIEGEKSSKRVQTGEPNISVRTFSRFLLTAPPRNGANWRKVRRCRVSHRCYLPTGPSGAEPRLGHSSLEFSVALRTSASLLTGRRR